MKRSLIIVPFALLVLLNACNVGTAVPQLSDPQWTVIAKTQEAMKMPPSQRIKDFLNATPKPENVDKFEALEDVLVGTYLITDVSFPSPEHFRVDVRCQCAADSLCCNPDHMFVVILQKISESRDLIVPYVPYTVQWLGLVCYDGQLNQIDVLYARWDRIKAFLFGQIGVAELEPEIIR